MDNAEDFFKDFETDAYFHIKEFAWNYKPIPQNQKQICDDFAIDFIETQDFTGDIKSFCLKYFRFYSLRIYDLVETFSIPLLITAKLRVIRLSNLIMSVNSLLIEHCFNKYDFPENLYIRTLSVEHYCKDLYVLYHKLAEELKMLADEHGNLTGDEAKNELCNISEDLQLLGNVMPLYLKMINFIDGTELWRQKR